MVWSFFCRLKPRRRKVEGSTLCPKFPVVKVVGSEELKDKQCQDIEQLRYIWRERKSKDHTWCIYVRCDVRQISQHVYNRGCRLEIEKFAFIAQVMYVYTHNSFLLFWIGHDVWSMHYWRAHFDSGRELYKSTKVLIHNRRREELDYIRTKQDFYRMQLDNLVAMPPGKQTRMRAMYDSYLKGSSGSSKALQDCMKNVRL